MAARIRRRANAKWNGSVEAGSGLISLGSGAFSGPYSLQSRVGAERHTNPEELIGAANAGCFAMSLANLVAEAGHDPREITANAMVNLEESDSGFTVAGIAIDAVGDVPGMDEGAFVRLAEEAKATCPISRALAGTDITLSARLTTDARDVA